MSLADELSVQVAEIFSEQWAERKGQKVPEAEDLTLSNEAVKLQATILYTDLSESTNLVDTQPATFAAEVYKAFLICAAKVVRAEGGAITAYDGDRLMGVFIGDLKNTRATRAALKMNWARIKVINPAIEKQYGVPHPIRHVTGIDTSDVLIARTGVRGANDLVWVGRAANHAAKLTALPDEFQSRITAEVYNSIGDNTLKITNGQSMWEQVTWNATGRTIYRSTWMWSLE